MPKFNIDVFLREKIRETIFKTNIDITKLTSVEFYKNNGFMNVDYDEREEWNAKCNTVIDDIEQDGLDDVFNWVALNKEENKQNIINYIQSIKFKLEV